MAVACQRIPADRAALSAAQAVRARDAASRPRTGHQRALKAARLRKDAARVSQALEHVQSDEAACDTAWTWPSHGPVLDQGGRDTCGFFAVLSALNTSPTWNGRTLPQGEADRVSDLAQAVSVGAGDGVFDPVARVLQSRGWVRSWRYLPAGDPGSVLAAARFGPVAVTVPFHSRMWDDPGVGGHWNVTGPYLWIDHGVTVVGVDPVRGRVNLLNTWGHYWGRGGRMWVTVAEFNVLYRGGGAAAVFTR